MFSIKHFLLGAALALLPLTLYGAFKINPGAFRIGLKTPSPQVLGYSTEISDFDNFKASLETQPSPVPTITGRITPALKKITPQVQTGSYEIRKVVVPEDISALIKKYATEYNVNSDMMIHIARCESNFRANAVNGPYGGIYQFVSATWISNRNAMGLDPDPNLRFNPEESIKTAAYKMSKDGFGAWPVCQAKARTLLSAK